jgi:hypothetical protein
MIGTWPITQLLEATGRRLNVAVVHVPERQEYMRVQVGMTVNGSTRTLIVAPRTTLLDALRDELALTGPKTCSKAVRPQPL